MSKKKAENPKNKHKSQVACNTMQYGTNKVHFIEVLKCALKNMITDGKQEITLGEIVSELKDQGLIFLIAILALPTSLPIPTPPLFTTIFGLPLLLLTAQLVYNLEHPWLPRWIADRKISIATFEAFIEKTEPIFLKFTAFLRPRNPYFTSLFMEKIVGIIACICAASVTLPIIFGNAVPSFGIFVMALGLLYKDGITVLIGILISIIGIAIATSVVLTVLWLGTEAFGHTLSKFKLF